MGFLPDAAVLISYTLATLVLFITPGPDMNLVLAKTLSEGRRQGLAAALGTSTGCLLHTLLAAAGLSAILAASPLAFTPLKVAGALYLLWLAVATLRKGSSLSIETGAIAPTSIARSFLTGLGINLTNPKIVLFFVTFLPQFVSVGDAHAAQKVAFLGIFFVLLTIPLEIGMVFAADRILNALRHSRRRMRLLDYAFASMFGAFALKILAMAR